MKINDMFPKLVPNSIAQYRVPVQVTHRGTVMIELLELEQHDRIMVYGYTVLHEDVQREVAQLVLGLIDRERRTSFFTMVEQDLIIGRIR